MTNKIIAPNFASGDVEFLDIDFSPDVDEGIKRTIAYNMGYDGTNEKFRLLATDADGNLVVNAGGTPASSISTTRATVTTTAQLLLDTNAGRKQALIKNIGATTVYIGETSGVLDSTGYPLDPNEVYEVDSYTGTLYGIVSGSSTLIAIIERD